MSDITKHTGSLQPRELEVVYAISRSIAVAINLEFALDEIVQLIRSVFIFDTIVLYTTNQENLLEPVYARAIGRGRLREADLAWGETSAQQAYQMQRAIPIVDEIGGSDNDRTNLRFKLALPVYLRRPKYGSTGVHPVRRSELPAWSDLIGGIRGLARRSINPTPAIGRAYRYSGSKTPAG